MSRWFGPDQVRPSAARSLITEAMAKEDREEDGDSGGVYYV